MTFFFTLISQLRRFTITITRSTFIIIDTIPKYFYGISLFFSTIYRFQTPIIPENNAFSELQYLEAFFYNADRLGSVCNMVGVALFK